MIHVFVKTTWSESANLFNVFSDKIKRELSENIFLHGFRRIWARVSSCEFV
ncbi:hypothetical protein WN48_05980 [Eufriesea mexicana]|nr:hypothetical protein WN48_05980 [Eufriesea mexicana]